MLCSKICRTHFIYKHQLLVSCSFCEELSFDSYMLQFISERGSKVHCFCSKSCLDLFIETSPDSMATEEYEKDLQEIREKLKKKQESDAAESMFKTVATQTDDVQTMCKCNGEKTRRILVPIKRLSNDVFDSRSLPLSDQNTIQRNKVARRT